MWENNCYILAVDTLAYGCILFVVK